MCIKGELLHAQLCAAERRLERAQRSVQRARDALPELQAEKRQRAAVPDHPRVAKDGAKNPLGWEHFYSYTREKYQEEEVKEADRRAVPVPREGEAVTKKAVLPSGDDERGWQNHWRRGVHGALQSWAKGDRGAVVYMLAKCAEHFGVIKEVCHLGTLASPTCITYQIDLHVTPPTNHLALVCTAWRASWRTLDHDARRMGEGKTR